MFSQSLVSGLSFLRVGSELQISWVSSAPSGTSYQIYLNHVLVWSGEETTALLPWPSGPIDADVGTVEPGEEAVDFSSTLPAVTAEYCELQWTGGTSLDTGDGVAGFKIFGSPAAGQSISYATAIGSVMVDQSEPTAPYAWTSGPLTTGVWQFAVVPFDLAGNLSSDHETASVTVAAPPAPPAPNDQGIRLTYTFDPATGIATLHWLASPG
jgi:hypothetical protein